MNGFGLANPHDALEPTMCTFLAICADWRKFCCLSCSFACGIPAKQHWSPRASSIKKVSASAGCRCPSTVPFAVEVAIGQGNRSKPEGKSINMCVMHLKIKRIFDSIFSAQWRDLRIWRSDRNRKSYQMEGRNDKTKMLSIPAELPCPFVAHKFSPQDFAIDKGFSVGYAGSGIGNGEVEILELFALLKVSIGSFLFFQLRFGHSFHNSPSQFYHPLHPFQHCQPAWPNFPLLVSGQTKEPAEKRRQQFALHCCWKMRQLSSA